MGLFTALAFPELAEMGVMRLVRLARLVRYFPSLAVIVQGLGAGLKSVGVLLVLLMLLFYLFAIMGITLFAETDPFHFGSIGRAVLTLCQLMLLSAAAACIAALGCQRRCRQ